MKRPLLHAHSLEFEHPGTGEVVSLVAPLPDDVESVVRRIYPQVKRVRRKLINDRGINQLSVNIEAAGREIFAQDSIRNHRKRSFFIAPF